MQNTYFSALARKKHFFKRSVLKYVSIKKMLLTPPEQKRRVCVNAPDGLTRNRSQGILKGCKAEGSGGSEKKEVVQKGCRKEEQTWGHGRTRQAGAVTAGLVSHKPPLQCSAAQCEGAEEVKPWQGERQQTQSPLR